MKPETEKDKIMKTYQVIEFNAATGKRIPLTVEMTSKKRAYSLKEAMQERRETRVYVRRITA